MENVSRITPRSFRRDWQILRKRNIKDRHVKEAYNLGTALLAVKLKLKVAAWIKFFFISHGKLHFLFHWYASLFFRCYKWKTPLLVPILTICDWKWPRCDFGMSRYETGKNVGLKGFHENKLFIAFSFEGFPHII